MLRQIPTSWNTSPTCLCLKRRRNALFVGCDNTCHTLFKSGAFGLPIDLISVPFLLDLAYFKLLNGLIFADKFLSDS